MKENIEKTYITKSQTHKLDSFLEHIAVSHNLYNYIGAISMAINYALDVLNDDAIISFSHCKDGICLSIICNNNDFSKVNFSDKNCKEFEKLFIIKSLTDNIKIIDNGKQMQLFFNIDGIEEQLALDRKEKLQAFFHNKTAFAK